MKYKHAMERVLYTCRVPSPSPITRTWKSSTRTSIIQSKVGGTDVEDICLPTGHIGIYVISKIQELFAPKIIAWLKEQEAFDENASDLNII